MLIKGGPNYISIEYKMKGAPEIRPTLHKGLNLIPCYLDRGGSSWEGGGGAGGAGGAGGQEEGWGQRGCILPLHDIAHVYWLALMCCRDCRGDGCPPLPFGAAPASILGTLGNPLKLNSSYNH